MTKKQFIELGERIKSFNSAVPPDQRFTDDQLLALACFCRAQNPRFDGQMWLAFIAGEIGPNGGAA